MAFTPRFSLPSMDATPPPPIWYRDGNWFYDNGYSPKPNSSAIIGNCTWYAYGRYAEVKGSFATNLSKGNAWRWFGEATAAGFHTAAWNDTNPPQPQLGAILCFASATGDNENHPGHLTVIEQINNDGTIIVSNSGYNVFYFRTVQVSRQDQYREPWYTMNYRNYVCKGIIYQDDQPIPPEPPDPPTPTTIKKMPLWMLLRYHI